MLTQPSPEEYAPFFAGYVSLARPHDVLDLLAEQPAALQSAASRVPESLETFRYAPGKWSVRQVFGHIGDAERAFAYRAHCISRGETANLPGFDEQQYVAESRYDSQPLTELVDELAVLRAASLAILRRLDELGWSRMGTANGTRISVRALAFIMAGHVAHHLAILKSRYGLPDVGDRSSLPEGTA